MSVFWASHQVTVRKSAKIRISLVIQSSYSGCERIYAWPLGRPIVSLHSVRVISIPNYGLVRRHLGASEITYLCGNSPQNECMDSSVGSRPRSLADNTCLD